MRRLITRYASCNAFDGLLMKQIEVIKTAKSKQLSGYGKFSAIQ